MDKNTLFPYILVVHWYHEGHDQALYEYPCRTLDEANDFLDEEPETLAAEATGPADWADPEADLYATIFEAHVVDTGAGMAVTWSPLFAPDATTLLAPMGQLRQWAREHEADNAAWRREIAMEAGMLHGVDAYNDAMGQSLEPDLGYDFDDF